MNIKNAEAQKDSSFIRRKVQAGKKGRLLETFSDGIGKDYGEVKASVGDSKG